MARAFNLLTVAFILAATATAARDRHVPLVPWKTAPPGAMVDAPLILYWVPASSDEVRRSPLLASADLVLFASRCVAMRIVRSDDGRRIAQLDAWTDLPATILTERDGTLLGRVDSAEGLLKVRAVEALVRVALERRSAEAGVRLDLARSHAEAGDKRAAAAVYRTVSEQRCICPREAREAERALKKLRRE